MPIRHGGSKEDDPIYLRVRKLIATQSGMSEAKLRPETRLFQDLGVDGDDAVEFLEDFQREFAVDLGGFRYDDHFGPEAPFNIFVFLWWLLFDRERFKKAPVRLSDLARSARVGRWLGRAE